MTYLDLIHWVVNPVIWAALTYLFFGTPRILSFPFVFMASYFVLVYIQALGVYREIVHEPLFLISVWLIPYLALPVMGIGLALAGHSSRRMAAAFDGIASSERDRLLTAVLPALSGLFMLLPVLFVLDKGTQSIAFFHLIFHPGDALETVLLRLGGLQSTLHPLLTPVYSYSRTLLFPMYIAVLASLHFGGRVSRLHLAAVLLAGIFFSVLTAAKAPLMIILASVGLAYYCAKRGKFSPVKLAVGGGVLVLLPALIYPLLYGVSGMQQALGVALESLWRRISLVPSLTSAIYFDAFTHHYEQMGVTSNRILAGIFQTNYVNVPALINDDYFGSSLSGGLVNASYFASFYADWGMAGVVAGTVAVGLLLVGLQVLFDRYHTDLLGTGLRIIVLIALTQLMTSNFYAVALGRGFLSVPLLLAALTPFFPQSPRRRETGRAPAKEVPA